MAEKHRGNNQKGTGYSPSGMNYPSGYTHPVENDRIAELNATAQRMGSFACWCGRPQQHDWPGKSEGEPHPRNMPNWDVDPRQWPHTPPLNEFRYLYDRDDNIWWRTECGHHQNLFEMACDRIDELEQELRDRNG